MILFAKTLLMTFLILILTASSLVANQELGTVEFDLKLEPRALVETYVQKDAAGEFLTTNEWWKKAVVCPLCMGGPDQFKVIKSSQIRPNGKNSFNVTYSVIGTMSGNKIDFKNEKLEHIFVVEKTKWGFKIKDPAFLMVSKKTVLEKFGSQLEPSSVEKLKSH